MERVWKGRGTRESAWPLLQSSAAQAHLGALSVPLNCSAGKSE